MKVSTTSLAAFISGSPRVVGVLLYGPDLGLVRDRSQLVIQSVLGQDYDPLQLTILPREGHVRLREELASLPLCRGRRVVRVLDATDGLAAVLESVTVEASETLIVVESGPLSARAKLRCLAERAPTWAAMPCYSDASSTTAELTRGLAAFGLNVTSDALGFLTAQLGDDFCRRQSELEKLGLFACDAEVVDIVHAVASCVSHVEASVGRVVGAALGGDVLLTDQYLMELRREGATGPGLLAALSAEMLRLCKVSAAMEQGGTFEAACRTLVPPVYPRQALGFGAAARKWPLRRLLWLGDKVRAADLACKQAGSRDFAIAAELLLTIARFDTGVAVRS